MIFWNVVSQTWKLWLSSFSTCMILKAFRAYYLAINSTFHSSSQAQWNVLQICVEQLHWCALFQTQWGDSKFHFLLQEYMWCHASSNTDPQSDWHRNQLGKYRHSKISAAPALCSHQLNTFYSSWKLSFLSQVYILHSPLFHFGICFHRVPS